MTYISRRKSTMCLAYRVEIRLLLEQRSQRCVQGFIDGAETFVEIDQGPAFHQRLHNQPCITEDLRRPSGFGHAHVGNLAARGLDGRTDLFLVRDPAESEACLELVHEW